MIASVDHVVLTTASLPAAEAFYCGLLGMKRHDYGEGHVAFTFGMQKFNVQVSGSESWLRADKPTPGALDICFLAGIPLDEVVARLGKAGIAIECGPVARTGGCGPMTSIYIRDPDLNLVEIAQPVTGRA